MRLSVAPLLVAAFSCSISQADQTSIEVAGLKIERGMPEEAVRFELVYPYGLRCEEDRGAGRVRECRITSEEDDNVGEIVFQNNYVVGASRFVTAEEGEFPAFRLLNELLIEVMPDEQVCAMVSSYENVVGVAFPTKTIWMSLHTRGGKDFFVVREILRQNPGPETAPDACFTASVDPAIGQEP